jgi:hypothetical protein
MLIMLTAPFLSSSVQIADAVKTLDMSMPSYSDIKGFKSSVENVKSLSVQETKGGSGGGVGISASQKKRGMPMSSVLPSMGKKSAKAKSSENKYGNIDVGGVPKYEF